MPPAKNMATAAAKKPRASRAKKVRLSDILARWDSGEGKPYKGRLIDWSAHKAEPDSIGCMCAQGQVLHLLGGWSPEKLNKTEQVKADAATAELLNISTAHAILLRSVNDKVAGAPSIVLTAPEKVLGDQARIVLAFWLHLDRMTPEQWAAAGAAAWDAAGDAAGDAAWDAARAAAWDAAGDAAGDAAWAAAGAAARAAAGAAAWDAAGACSEIQGARLLRERGEPFFFLPMFGFADPEAIPALPAGYGRAR
jgi:hypothetical protein